MKVVPNLIERRTLPYAACQDLLNYQVWGPNVSLLEPKSNYVVVTKLCLPTVSVAEVSRPRKTKSSRHTSTTPGSSDTSVSESSDETCPSSSLTSTPTSAGGSVSLRFTKPSSVGQGVTGFTMSPLVREMTLVTAGLWTRWAFGTRELVSQILGSISVLSQAERIYTKQHLFH